MHIKSIGYIIEKAMEVFNIVINIENLTLFKKRIR